MSLGLQNYLFNKYIKFKRSICQLKQTLYIHIHYSASHSNKGTGSWWEFKYLCKKDERNPILEEAKLIAWLLVYIDGKETKITSLTLLWKWTLMIVSLLITKTIQLFSHVYIMSQPCILAFDTFHRQTLLGASDQILSQYNQPLNWRDHHVHPWHQLKYQNV